MKNVNYNVAYDYIRKRILSGEFAAGSPLMANLLATEIGLSRTSVREALRQLEVDGLVSIRPHLGASVKTMDIMELRDLCELRLALESHAAGLAARNRTAADLQEIKFALEVMRSLTDRIVASENTQPLSKDLMHADVRFHIAIMSAAKNEQIKREILRLHLVNRIVAGKFSTLGTVERTAAEKEERNNRCRAWMVSHEAIYEAIARQDVAAAKKEMEHHIQAIIDNRLRQLAQTQAGNASVGRKLTAEEAVYIN